MIKTEVLIIGGGPAGSSCARTLKQAGVNCIVLDKSAFPRFKPCAGWITPQVLKWAGLDPATYPHGLTEFTSFDVSIYGLKFKLPTRQFAIRRYEFDRWLLERADPEFHVHEVREIRLENGEYVVDGEFSARYLVGTGGTHCPVRRTFFGGLQEKEPGALVVAQEQEFQYDLADTHCKLWFFQKKLPGYAWYVPKKDGYVNVGLGGFAASLKGSGDTLKNHWNLLVKQLEEAGLITGHDYNPLGHSYILRRKSAQVRSGDAFLVGDSLGLATLDMGEGIGPAIRSGQLAAESILSGTQYSVASIPRFSFPSLLGIRKGG
jgi:flavin-dependent dehydrogenase